MSPRQKRYPKYEAVGKALHEKYEALIRDVRPKITYEVIKKEGGPAPRITSRLLGGYEELGRPSARKNIVKIIIILVRKGVIKTKEDADEFLRLAGLVLLSEDKEEDREVLNIFESKEALDRPRYYTRNQTELIGRNKDIEAIFTKLQKEGRRFLTLVGPPGVGKSELARQIYLLAQTQDYFSHVLMIFLEDENIPADMLSVLPVEAVKSSSDVLRAVIKHLQRVDMQKRVLLILDKCEQIEDLDATRTKLSDVLDKHKQLTILATSRVRFSVYEYEVLPLIIPNVLTYKDERLENLLTYDAVKLFLESAKRSNEDFNLIEQNATTTAEICIVLAGLPLALLIAGSWVKRLGIEGVYQRLLNSGIQELEYDFPDNTHHRTLDRLIERSYELLDEQEQTLFRRLGVFIHRCSIRAVAAICNFGDLPTSETDLLNILRTLSNHNLVTFEKEVIDIAHNTLRDYARRKLGAEEKRKADARFLFYYKKTINDEMKAAMEIEDREENFKAADIFFSQAANMIIVEDRIKVLKEMTIRSILGEEEYEATLKAMEKRGRLKFDELPDETRNFMIKTFGEKVSKEILMNAEQTGRTEKEEQMVKRFEKLWDDFDNIIENNLLFD